MTKQGFRDWYILGALTTVVALLWVYVFRYPTPAVFCTGSGAMVSILGMYHWFTIYDDKKADA